MLGELDEPGEWYLDRSSGVLYLYPPTDIVSDTEIFLSLMEKPLISIRGTNFVTFSCLSFAYTCGSGLF